MFSEDCQPTTSTVAVGDNIIVKGSEDRQRYFCTIEGKVYKDNAGNDIQESVGIVRIAVCSVYKMYLSAPV